PAPVVAVAHPAALHPVKARPAGLPVARDPEVLAARPAPVAVDPDEARPRRGRPVLGANRRRRTLDVPLPLDDLGRGGAGRRGRRHGLRGGPDDDGAGARLAPVAVVEHPLAALVGPARLDPDLALDGRKLPAAADPDVAPALPAPVARD